MAHSNRSSRSDKSRKEKANRKAAQRHRYESYRDSGNNSKRAKSSKRRTRPPGHAHSSGACGNIGCLRDSDVARIGHYNLMKRTHGVEFAINMVKKRGWNIAEV